MSSERSQGEPSNKPQERKGWRRFFGKGEPKTVDLSDLPPAREAAAVVLARTTLPDRVVTLEDISIHHIPINWGALKRLGLAVNRLKETPIEKFEVEELKPPAAVFEAIPMVASAIAHHYTPEIPIILPSEDEVKALKPWLRDVSSLLGRFSPRLQHRFGRYIEKKAEDAIEQAAGNVLGRVDILGEVKKPRARFVPELANIYRRVAAYRTEDVEGWFENYTQEVPIERKVAELIVHMRGARYGHDNTWLSIKSFPLMVRGLRLSKFPPDTMVETEVAVAGSEVMQGIEGFLNREGVSIPPAPHPVATFDIFDYETWGGDNIWRSLGETFKPEQIEAARRELPNILAEVKEVLPENGPAVIESVKTLAENILILSKQGVSNAEIAAAIFAKKIIK